jgi:hypothetical protein
MEGLIPSHPSNQNTMCPSPVIGGARDRTRPFSSSTPVKSSAPAYAPTTPSLSPPPPLALRPAVPRSRAAATTQRKQQLRHLPFADTQVRMHHPTNHLVLVTLLSTTNTVLFSMPPSVHSLDNWMNSCHQDGRCRPGCTPVASNAE